MSWKYLAKKTINIKTNYLIIIVALAILVVVGCFSYAIFTVSSESKGSLNIVTGNLYSHLDSEELDGKKSIVIPKDESKIIHLDLVNVNGVDAKVNLYYTATSDKVEVAYLEKHDAVPSKTGDILTKSGTKTDHKTIDIKITNLDLENEVTVTFGSDVGLKNASLSFPTEKKEIQKYKGNPYISKAYIYNDDANSDTYCLTGDEESCQKTDCYKLPDEEEEKEQDSQEKPTCQPNTIIKYAVSDTEEKVFYVIEDKDDKITMQQRENTIKNVAWYADNEINTNGPLTILEQLGNETKKWDNVLEQKYKMGETTFNNNIFTGCSTYNSCSTNTYTLGEIKARARMITVQEAATLNCTDTASSCPKWMYNYLYDSIKNGATVDDSEAINEQYNNGYWTTSADSTTQNNAFYISNQGALTSAKATDLYGTRAVVEIKK